MVQARVRVVEHERGLELQVNCPEFTLATMLPIVNASDAAKVLKIEDFSRRLEARVSEPVRDLKRAVCSTKVATAVIEPLRDLNIEDFSVRTEATARETVGALEYPQPGVNMSLVGSPVVRVTVSEPELPPTVTSNQTSRTRK